MLDTSRFSFRPFGLAAALAFALVGCGDTASKPAAEGAPKATEKTIVGVVFDSGGRGDKSFNDSAYAGVQRASEKFSLDVRTIDSKKDSDYEGNITGLAEQGAKLVFAVGMGQGLALEAAAKKFPDVKFAIVDTVVDAPNVRSLLFSEEQGSFLAGYAAALVSKSGKVGFVGGKKIDLIEKFEAGFTAGAKLAKPGITVLPAKYTDSWDDTSKGKALAAVLYGDGADVVYHAAGRAGLGVFAAVKEANGSGPITKYAIGVDSNQDDIEKGMVLTSMLKRVDEAVFSTIEDTVGDKFSGGTKRYDLKANGVGLTDFANTKDVIGADNMAKIEAVSARIKAGEIVVPEKLADIAAFLAKTK